MSSDVDEQTLGDTAEAWQVLGLVNEWLKHAEAKAGLALATAGVIGGLLYSLVGEMKDPPCWIIALMVVSLFCIFGAGVCGAIAVVPRLWRKESATSKIYYGHIARAYPKKTKKHPSKLPVFQTAFAKATDSKRTLFEELSSQVWANAHVASVKYKWSTWAIVLVIGAAVGVALTAIGITWESR